ncbi:autotransporter domain-containing protein [Stenotrophomonas rhizophila]|uniref:Autotransporter domain-containing protein n=1 Tax=Stenotrophomonas rhizophila TaxID=216778 RepID=A0AAW5PEM7_9GAMM|nr:autotransporter domain-containing protein [Stenotrophomonas rhizophila]MCS4278148.1 hypothetical protein [Stenotrophomonas rhizophila]
MCPKSQQRRTLRRLTLFAAAFCGFAATAPAMAALSSGCQAIQNYWGNGITVSGGIDDYQADYQVAQGERIHYTVTSSGSTNATAGAGGGGFTLWQGNNVTDVGENYAAQNNELNLNATHTVPADFSDYQVYLWSGTGGGTFTATVTCQAPAPPTISDARISISGGTGTGGAYKIGDILTATWNNSASGDNNAGVSAVTVDFSQFGGGSAVAAINSAGIWTATYTLTAGFIDAANRNVSVTATNGGGSTTRADTTNATVDTIAPTLTNANINISGASGTGGAYKLGDTVTAVWNNMAGGDNNSDTISTVSVNFSQFGGGAAVTAVNSSGVWTATYTIVGGAINGVGNRNVTLTATDNAGNTTTTADTSNATVDNRIASVNSIAPMGAPAASDAAMAFTVTFDETVSNVSTDDFTLVGTGSASGSIVSVSASSGTSVNVNVGSITGSGTLKVNLNGATDIADAAGNTGVAAYSSGATHTVAMPAAPGAPVIGAATPGDAQVSVAFTSPADDGGSAITGYLVTASPGGTTAGGNGSTTSPIVVTGLTNGTTYTFDVKAINATGTGAASGATNAVTPKGNQSITFGNPGTQTMGTSPSLSATATSGLVPVFSSSTGGVCTVSSGGTLTFVSAGVCTIDADQAGSPAWNAATTVTQTFTVNAVVPGAPTIGTATAGNTQATVTFTSPSFTGGSAITVYTVTANPGGVTATGAGSPVTLTGLTNGVAYTFTVTASNAAGTGDASAASNSVMPASPQTITFNNPGTQNFGTTPTLTATSSAGAGYPVSFVSATTGVCTITSGGALTFLSAGTCTINADQGGDGRYLAAPQAGQSFTVAPVVPGAPPAPSATAGDTQVSIAFVPPVFTGGASITGYTVTVSPADVAPVNGASSPMVVTGLTNGVAYTFTVTADNAAGAGPSSTASSAVTPKAAQLITFNNPGTQNFGTTPTLTATADSGLTPTFTSSTTGVCTITTGGMLTFVGAGTCTLHADQAGNGSYLPAAQVTRTFTVNAVVPSAPDIGTATVIGAGQVSVTFTAPGNTGGAPVSGYTATAMPGGATVAGSGSPLSFNGLTPGVTYTFTVTATNSTGTGSASAASNAVTPAPALVAGPATATVAYGAVATTITLPITGTPTAVAVITAPSHGTATVNGMDIEYVPAMGYAGPDSFTYRASDAYTTSAAAAVDITVSAPTLSLDPASLASITASNAYRHVLSASGGTGPYVYAVSGGALPAGVQLSPGGELFGTPNGAGSFSFTVLVTDSSTGTGPFTASRSYTLVVDAPTLMLDQPQLPPADGGQDYRQRLTASGGTAPYRFALRSGSLPPGLLLAESGDISGEATSAGTFDFDVEVTDANGFSGQRSYRFVVAAAVQTITGFTATPADPVYSVGGSFRVAATGGDSGNPIVFASTTPSVCAVQSDTVTMVSAGRCVLTANQAGDALRAAATQLQLEVNISMATPVISWQDDLNKVYGESDFELAAPQSTSPGVFTFSSSNTAVATVNGRRVTVMGEGSTVLTATQAASGSYAAASIELRLVVAARPDPTADAQVVGTLQAQADASIRFAQVQQGNIRDRLRQVRVGSNASSFNIALAYAGGLGVPGISVPLNRAADSMVNGLPRLPEGWGAWAAGTATFGKAGRGSGGFDFNTGGITVGADRAIGENVLLGLAGSWGRQDTDFNKSPSSTDADQRSLAVYGLWRAGQHVFFDGMLASGRLDFDVNRWNELVGASAHGSRQGDQWFGSLTFGYEHRSARGTTLTSYGRYDGHRARLDGYREHGLDAFDLSYGRQDIDNSSVALGIEGNHAFQGKRVSWRPHWNVEYRKALENRSEATMNYVQRPNASDYVLAMRSYNDDALSIGAGVDLQLDSGWMFSLLLGHEQGRNSLRSNSIGVQVRFGGQGGGGVSQVDADGRGARECAQQRHRDATSHCGDPLAGVRGER